MAPQIFAEKDFGQILIDPNGYGHVFLERIRARNWYNLIYDRSETESFYCPELVKMFYTHLDHASVDSHAYQFTVHMPNGDFHVTLPLLEEVTHVPTITHHSEPLPLIDYMTVMGARCTEQDRGLKASTTFRNVHCIGRWILRNILGLDHTTTFNRPVLQIIHDLMTRQRTVCLNKVIFHALIVNSSRTRGAKYSHPVLITRLCKTFLPDEFFESFDREFVAPERPTSAYTSCLHALWTPTVQPENVPVVSSSSESYDAEDEPEFWRQEPPVETRAFMSTLWKGMKKIFKGQVRLRKKMEEQTSRLEEQSSRLESIEATLRRTQSAGPSTTAVPKRRRE